MTIGTRRRSPKPHQVRTRDPKYHVGSYQRGSTIFFESKFQKYSEMVRIDKVDEAKESVRRLQQEFDKARQLVKMRRLVWVTNRAANIAGIASRNKRLSEREREESKEISQLYRDATKKFSKMYAAAKKKVARSS